MTKLWGGRFEKETDATVRAFNDSLPFDQRLFPEDIEGSLAQAEMLLSIGVLTKEEEASVKTGLLELLKDYEAGNLSFEYYDYEDVHSFVEGELTKRIGDAAKKLHTGRSRNDQVALDMKLYVRKKLKETDSALHSLLRTLHAMMEREQETLMPGFTHLQKAQPTTLSHHLGAYFEMFRRDRGRIKDTIGRLNECPLGAGALAGSTFPLNRELTSSLLGFHRPTRNSMDTVSDRDYLVEALSALSLVMMHLSRFSEEIILWNSNDYGYITLDDAYSTGSSIMPQKKNPDIAELVRGKSGRVFGHLQALLTLMKGLPLAYNKDLQEDKEAVFDAFDTVLPCLHLFRDMLESTVFHKDVMLRSCALGYTNATDVADYLAAKGLPFRDAHEITGRLVLLAEKKHCALDDLKMEEYKAHSSLFEEDLYDAISMKSCVDRRNTPGAPGRQAMKEALEEQKLYLEGNEA